MTRDGIFEHEPLSTWEIEEKLLSDCEHVVTLKIHGCVYATGKGRLVSFAYKDLVEKIAPALSRSVTIARLMGGDL